MKLNHLLIALLAAGLMAFTACNETAQATSKAEQSESEANADEGKGEADGEGEGETDGEGDGEQNETRLSPLKEANALIGETKVQVKYGSPAVKGRQIWGKLVPYGEVWRTGANEATTFEVDKDVTINGEALPAGKYAFFTIPTADGWTLIFNSTWDQWGHYNYDESKDVLRVAATANKVEDLQERMEVLVQDGGEISIAWEYLQVPFTVAEAAGE